MTYDIIKEWRYIVKDGFPADGVKCLVSRKIGSMDLLYYFKECPKPVIIDGEVINHLSWDGPGWYTSTTDGVKDPFENEIVAWLAIVPHYMTETDIFRITGEEARVHSLQ